MRAFSLLALLGLLSAGPPAYAAVLGLPVRHAGESGIAAPYFRGEVLEVRLGSQAAAAARAAVTASGGTPSRIGRLGVAAVDRTMAALGGWLEPEFQGEHAPEPGSGETDFTAFYLMHLGAGVDLGEALDRLRAVREIESADPIAVVPVAAVPNDSLWSLASWLYQPSRHDVHAPEAWDVTTGDTSIVVAVLDTGVLPYHPDLGGSVAGLHGQMWVNPMEAAGLPQVDDDLNGFVDDVAGWDFVDLSSAVDVSAGEDWQSPDNDPNDFAGHGTFVSGLIGAITDNAIGGAGAAWKVRLMPLRMGWSALSNPLGLVDMSYAAQAIRYATRMGASVVNCSFATLNTSGLYAAAAAATRAGVTIVAASGNNAQPHELADRDDVIGVAATDANDQVAAFSNLGDFVDLSAPGVGLASTFLSHDAADSIGTRQPAYAAGLSGTSFAAPLASGAVALLQARQHALGLRPLYPTGALLRLRETADDIAAQNPSLTGYGTGRLNLARALTEVRGSTAERAGSTTIGPAVVLPTASGRAALAYVTNNSRLLIVDAVSGDTLVLSTLPGRPARQLAAADVGGALGIEMFVGTVNGKMAGFDRDGRPLAGWPVSGSGSLFSFTGGPALGDLDGDGTLEVISGCTDGNVYAWTTDGNPVPGFPVALGSPITGPVALASLDNNAGVEIVVGTADARLHVLGGSGAELPGWPVTLAGAPLAPLVARFGASPIPAVVAVAGGTLHVFNPDGGARLTTALGGTAAQDPAAADLDGDGVREIVVPLTAPNAIAVFDSSGAPLTARGWPAALTGFPMGPVVVGPLRPGGRPGVLLMQGFALVALGDSAQTLGRFPEPGGAGLAPTLAELDGDGATEVAAGSGPDSALYIYDAGGGTWAVTASAWPTPRADFARTGAPDSSPSLPIRDDVAPAAIPDLAGAFVAPDSVRLTWTAPGDNGTVGRAFSYRLHVTPNRDGVWDFSGADVRDDLPAPDSAGVAQRFSFAVGAPNAVYYATLRAVDAAGNVGALSNIAAVLTPLRGPASPAGATALLVHQRPSAAPVDLAWQAAPAAGAPATRVHIYDLAGRCLRTLECARGVDAGTVRWDGRDLTGRAAPAGLYFARLTRGGAHAEARVVLIP